jgi:hypothetical protein
MSIVLNGTTGVTTPDVTSDGLTVDSTTLVVDETNNRVGVGTSSPAAKLDVYDTAVATYPVQAAQFGNSGGAQGAFQIIGYSNLEWGFNALNSRNLVFNTNQTERMRINSSGNVGIGTSSPGAKLHLFAATAGAFAGLRVGQNDGYAQIGTDNGGLLMYTGTTERARIDSSGNLLVGTTSALYSNRVVSSGGFASLNHPQFNITSTNSSTPFEWVLRSGSSMQFYVNNATVLATLSSSGVWTNASDARYKENIRPASYGLSEVMQLQPRAYNIIGSEKQEIGFVAQEVEQLIPELVESTENSVTGEDRLTLSYGQLSAVIVKAIQEQQAIIESLTARVSALEASNV